MSSGNGTAEKARQMFRANPGLPREVVAAELGMSARWAGSRKAEVKAEVRNGAASAVPSVAANGPGEAPPVARSNGKPAGPVTSTKAQQKARRKRHLVVAMTVVATLVAGAVGTLSYSLMQMLAAVAGTGWHAYILPVALDGMMLCGALCLAVAPRYRPAWIAMALGLAASMAANGIGAHDPGSVVDLVLIARVMSSLAPLCLLLCVVFILHAYKELAK